MSEALPVCCITYDKGAGRELEAEGSNLSMSLLPLWDPMKLLLLVFWGAGLLPGIRKKDQALSRALPCANPLDFHAELQVRVNAALSFKSLNSGWVFSLAAITQLCGDLAWRVHENSAEGPADVSYSVIL